MKFRGYFLLSIAVIIEDYGYPMRFSIIKRKLSISPAYRPRMIIINQPSEDGFDGLLKYHID